MLSSLACLVLVAATGAPVNAPAATPSLPYVLPGTMEHHRFYVETRAPSGAAIRLLTDTGGGMNLMASGAEKLGIAYDTPADPYQQPARMTPWPAYAGPWIPRPKSATDDLQLPVMAIADKNQDGMLGAAWHADRTWEWDYRKGTMRLLPDGALPSVDASHVVALGFQEQDGKRTSNFPRIPVRIDGEPLQLLFDTGATFRLSETAARTLGDPAVRERAGSFITRSVIERWHARHPDWPWIEQGDSGLPMIQVPSVEVAGYVTGPVWFSGRPDDNFHKWMAQWMDRPIDGALGGSAFAGFRITVDYPAAKATFER